MAGARPQIGIENEYGHIVLEQGIPGLLLWVAFICTCVFRRTKKLPGSPTAMRYAHAFVIIMWCVAPLGAGILSGIPAAALLLLMMGVRMGAPVPMHAGKALRHVGQPKRERSIGIGRPIPDACALAGEGPLLTRGACRATSEPLERAVRQQGRCDRETQDIPR